MSDNRQTQIDADLRRARRAAHDAARHALTCAECGTEDGLVGWHRDVILAIIQDDECWLPKEVYLANGYNPNKLYTRCQTCKATTDDVLNRCRLLTAAEIAAWVLPEGYPTFHNLTVVYLTERIEADWRRQ